MENVFPFWLLGSCILFVYGAVIGSFLGVIIERLPKGETIIRGRSHCDFCRKRLRWFELLPIISFFFQGGKCLRCHKKLSWRYPLLESLTGVIFSLVWVSFFPAIIPLLIALVIACILIVIIFIDIDYMIIPDSLVILGTVAAIFFHLVATQANVMKIVQNNFVSGIISSILFYGLWLVTKKKGIGFGDIKLVFFLGVLVGFPRVIGSIYMAFLTGAVAALIIVFRGRKTLKSAVPFGPFLVLGAGLACVLPVQEWLSFFL